YVAVNDKPAAASADRSDINLYQSTDGGATWSAKRRVNDDSGTTAVNDQWQPAIAVTPDGSGVGIFWYDRRNDPSNVQIDRYGQVYDVSGHTLAPDGGNFKITDVAFPPFFGADADVNPLPTPYMGDYDQAAAD